MLLSQSAKPSHQMNIENIGFYDQIKPSGLRKLAEERGMDSCNDVKAIHSIIEQANHILEVGAGYGRVLDYLLTYHPKIQADAIEPAGTMFKYLKAKYQDQVNICNTSLQMIETKASYDLILWLWTGMADMSWSEQIDAIETLFGKLDCGGTLIIDVYPEQSLPINMASTTSHIYTLNTSGATIDTYWRSREGLNEIALDIGFSSFSEITYFTGTESKRHLCLLSR